MSSSSSASSASAAVTPTTNLRDFLARPTDDVLNDNNDNGPITVVMGNEAGDADSIVSALVLAYLIHNDDPSTRTIPLVSVPRADMTLRRDVRVLLEDWCGVDPNLLWYADDERSSELFSDENPERLSVILTDHNALRSDFVRTKKLESSVTMIMDHHEDQGRHLHVKGKNRNIAFVNGEATTTSTCTLIAERALSSDNKNIDARATLALLGVIALDSVGLRDSPAGKAMDRDRRAVERLLNAADWSALDLPDDVTERDGQGRPNPSVLYDKLSSAKFDVEFWRSMSTNDRLRIDFKSFRTSDGVSTFGMSSVLISTEEVLRTPGFVTNALTFMQERNLDLLGVSSCVLSPTKNLERRLLLVGRDPSVVSQMAEQLLTATPSLELEEESSMEYDNDDGTVRSFQQGNLKASRKQIAPIMMKCRFGSNDT